MCVAPLTIVNKNTSERVKVPCGRCYECISSRRFQWAIRMQLEAEYNPPAVFATLTYDNEHCDGKLHYKSHIVPFLRNFRREEKLRYVMVGEYGTRTHRPHYHMVIFGLLLSRVDEILEKYWPYGSWHLGELAFGGAQYVAKYHILSKIDKPPYWDNERTEFKSFWNFFEQSYDLDCDEPCWDEHEPDEFFHMSRRPGIGAPYMTDDNVHAHRLRPTPYCTAAGKVQYLPKYLKHKIYDDAMKAEINEEMAKQSYKRQYDMAKQFGMDFDDFFDSEFQKLRRQIDKHKRLTFKAKKKDGTF